MRIPCSLGDRATRERALEVVILGESPEHDVDGALALEIVAPVM
jgi:hypothetical protein